MRITVILVGAALLLASCASMTPLPDATLQGKAAALLNGPSSVDSVQVKAVPDYSMNRWTLVRVLVVTTKSSGSETKTSSHDAPDHPMGIDFGNGLFLDANGNLSVRFDPLVGVNDAFRGKTEYAYHLTNDENTTTRITDYENDTVSVVDPAPFLLARNDKFAVTAKKFSYAFTNFEVKDKDHISIAPSFTLSPFDGQSYTNLPNGVKKEWWASFLGVAPFINSDTYTLSNNSVVDSDKTFLVEGKADYIRVAFTKSKYYFRIYRSPTVFLVLNEVTGAPAFIATRTDTTLDWDAKLMGVLGLMTDKIVHYQVKAIPNP